MHNRATAVRRHVLSHCLRNEKGGTVQIQVGVIVPVLMLKEWRGLDLTLYGHNQSLFVEAGDWVAPEQMIAQVGNSGGQRDPGLYFEIRKDGEPTNPASWCN